MAKHRGHNEGTISKRSDGRWQARVSLPLGRRKTLYGATREEVAKRLAEELVEVQGGALPPAGRETVGQWLAAWLLSVKLSKIRPRTWERYRQYIELHAIPALGHRPLSKLQPEDLEALYRAKLEEGLSVRTVHHLHVVLKTAFTAAGRRRRLRFNPAQVANAPNVEHDEDVKRINAQSLTERQLKAFVRAAEGHRLEALFVLAATLGMREGELLGLRWSCVDLAAGTLAVESTLQVVKESEGERISGERLSASFVLAPPKTEKSRRLLTLTPPLVERLRRHRARQGEEKLRAGKLWHDHGLVFTTEIGSPIHYANLLRREYHPLLAKIGLVDEKRTTEKRVRRGKEVTVERVKLVPLVTFHALRHSCASALLRDRTPLPVVSALLGHSRPSTTADLYQHAESDLVANAVTAMSRRLLGS